MFDWKEQRILVVAAHPDDEVLGMGGTIHHLVQTYGCDIHVLILGEGITSRSENRNPEAWQAELIQHQSHIESARQKLGYASYSSHHFPDNRFDGVDLLDLIKVIEAEKERLKPTVIFTHHGGDTNIDHRRCFEAVLTAIRPVEEERVHSLFSFEIPSSTEWQAFHAPMPWQANVFLSISEEDLIAKIQAMEQYEFERRQYPHPRSPEALRILAQRHGIRVGSSLAEAFLLVRSIQK